MPIAVVGASSEPPRNAEPTTSKGLSISWAWAIAALIDALVLGGAVGAASAGDDAAKHLADERAAQINDLNRQIDRVQQQRDDARKQARLAATTTSTTTTLPPTTTTTAPPPPSPTAPQASAPASAPTAFYANCTAARAGFRRKHPEWDLMVTTVKEIDALLERLGVIFVLRMPGTVKAPRPERGVLRPWVADSCTRVAS